MEGPPPVSVYIRCTTLYLQAYNMKPACPWSFSRQRIRIGSPCRVLASMALPPPLPPRSTEKLSALHRSTVGTAAPRRVVGSMPAGAAQKSHLGSSGWTPNFMALSRSIHGAKSKRRSIRRACPHHATDWPAQARARPHIRAIPNRCNRGFGSAMARATRCFRRVAGSVRG
jgi:hypothetical protein